MMHSGGIFLPPALKSVKTSTAYGHSKSHLKNFVKQKTAPCEAAFLDRLGALHVDSARTFVRFLNFEGNFVVDTEVVELDIDQSRRVEKDIFFSAFLGDESKALVGQAFDGTHHRIIISELSANLCLWAETR